MFTNPIISGDEWINSGPMMLCCPIHAGPDRSLRHGGPWCPPITAESCAVLVWCPQSYFSLSRWAWVPYAQKQPLLAKVCLRAPFQAQPRLTALTVNWYNLLFHCFEEDFQIYLPLKTATDSFQRLMSCLEDVKLWMSLNLRKINENRTEVIIFSKSVVNILSVLKTLYPRQQLEIWMCSLNCAGRWLQ